MATIHYAGAEAAAGSEPRRVRGIFRRMIDGIVAAREREARRQIARQLATFDDRTLIGFGVTREEIARWYRDERD